MNEKQEEYKKFAEDFVLRFPEEERSKVSVFLNDLMNSRTHGLMDSDIEGLFSVFSDDAIENGSFHYKEFSSFEEIENWNPNEKIAQAFLILSFREEPLMSDIMKIYSSLQLHFADPDSADNLGTQLMKNEENLPSKLIYQIAE
ncbi:MAG: hypothetical protein K6G80_11240 [Treponema sp.]|nr:hypothetical protein [Treponema sp.]